MRRVNMEAYGKEPSRYELRSGAETNAPSCPYGNRYQWVGFDLQSEEYVRFTKSVFKLLITEYDKV